MKTTGIVRRLDDLGRIVIPREYRKMHKIGLGDPMEIIALENGDIVLKKVDMSAELAEIAEGHLETLSADVPYTLLICDTNSWILGSGINRANFIGNSINSGILKAIRSRKLYNTVTNNDVEGIFMAESGFDYIGLAPVMGDSDCFGALVALSNSPIPETDMKLLKIVALLIGKSLQKY